MIYTAPMTGTADYDPAPAELLSCRLCPRLAAYREAVARAKRRAYAEQEYWGRPVPGFGDLGARLLIVGLAPGAHGSNRTGRMFTGDAAGNFLHAALHRAGLANRPASVSRDDGLALRGAFITAAVRCVPPGNRPAPGEIANCRRWLARDLSLPRLRVLLALGRIGHEALLDLWVAAGVPLVKARLPFAHGAEHALPPLPEWRPGMARSPGEPRRPWVPPPARTTGVRAAGVILIDSYHVSFQNTNTGKLTAAMFDAVVARAKALARSGQDARPGAPRR